jgi:hypothetical protein
MAPFIMSLLCASCDSPAIGPHDSLVGAKSLPPTSELRKETIGFYYGQDQSLTRQLSYELTPEGHWDIVISDRKDNGRELSRKSFPLEAGRADSFRRKLWRLRPEKLDGVQWTHRPSDCPKPPTDTIEEISVAFIQEGPKPGVSDDKLGVFGLPHSHICNTPKSVLARRIIDEVVSSLPGANFRAQFHYWPPLP